MAAPILRHYKARGSATGGTAVDVTGAVPAGRALVVSKIIVECDSSAGGVTSLHAGTGTTTAELIAYLLLQANQVYTETGIVLLAGESLRVTSSVSNAGGTV